MVGKIATASTDDRSTLRAPTLNDCLHTYTIREISVSPGIYARLVCLDVRISKTSSLSHLLTSTSSAPEQASLNAIIFSSPSSQYPHPLRIGSLYFTLSKYVSSPRLARFTSSERPRATYFTCSHMYTTFCWISKLMLAGNIEQP